MNHDDITTLVRGYLDERDEARAEVERLQEALVWMSGSPSFAPDGEARGGFEKLVAPLLRAIKPRAAIEAGEHDK